MVSKTRVDIHSADVPVLCRACEARHGGICGALAPEELLRLGRVSSRHEYSAGTTLVTPGVRIEHCSNILSGVVKLSKLLPDGRKKIVELQFAPDFLGRPFAGESDMLVEAATDVRLCSFPLRTLETLRRDTPQLQDRLHRQSLRQLDEARDWMMTLGKRTAAERVASFLLLLARHVSPFDEGCSETFDLPLSRTDCADFLGLTHETVSRQLTGLRNAGAIRVEKARHVTVMNFDALKKAAAV